MGWTNLVNMDGGFHGRPNEDGTIAPTADIFHTISEAEKAVKRGLYGDGTYEIVTRRRIIAITGVRRPPAAPASAAPPAPTSADTNDTPDGEDLDNPWDQRENLP